MNGSNDNVVDVDVDADVEMNNESNNDPPSPEARTRSSEAHTRGSTQHSRPSFLPLEEGEQERRILSHFKELPLSFMREGLDYVIEKMPNTMKLDRIYIVGMLIQIITPSKDLSQAIVMRKYKNQTTSNTATAYRSIFLFLNVSEKQQGQNRLFYMIMNSTSNKDLFEHNSNFRDNGVITIGTLMLIVNPDPVENFLNKIPIVTTKERAVVFKPI
jgi:hypothetical protein